MDPYFIRIKFQLISLCPKEKFKVKMHAVYFHSIEKDNLIQVWCFTEATEAIASVAPGLCLGALWNVPIENYKFLIEVPFTKEKLPCPFKYEVSVLLIVTIRAVS